MLTRILCATAAFAASLIAWAICDHLRHPVDPYGPDLTNPRALILGLTGTAIGLTTGFIAAVNVLATT
ncbi:hypothetical protein [Streptomyces sp. N35]|uniref:hypothetical protein n=1 Tax=Streptomyces sp. N35 TaxID=2795730 RepID=UPI0018F3F963|nr:hypothetical protein [Streptomyces sp. N35]